MIFFARNGKPLGLLNAKVDHISLLKSTVSDTTPEEIKKMKRGDYIQHKKTVKPLGIFTRFVKWVRGAP